MKNIELCLCLLSNHATRDVVEQCYSDIVILALIRLPHACHFTPRGRACDLESAWAQVQSGHFGEAQNMLTLPGITTVPQTYCQ
jgi:hypothetical protein